MAAAAALSLIGTVAAGALVTPAHADCLSVTAYYYKNKQGRQYIFNEWCVYNFPGWRESVEPGATNDSDVYPAPAGVPTGAGYWVRIPGP